MMKFHSLPRIIALAMAGFAFGLTANAADTTSTVSRDDKSFLENAWKSGMEEIAVSQAALPNLTEVLIQQFAQMMVSDHTPANAELSALAARKGVLLPEKRPDVAKWEKKKDKNFDAKEYNKSYLEKMIKDHDDAVELFTKASQKSDDPEIQAFATKTLGTLKAHQAQAKDLKKAEK